MALRISMAARYLFPYNAIRFVISVLLKGRRCIERYFQVWPRFRWLLNFLRILYARNRHSVMVIKVRLVRLLRDEVNRVVLIRLPMGRVLLMRSSLIHITVLLLNFPSVRGHVVNVSSNSKDVRRVIWYFFILITTFMNRTV